MLDRGQSRVFGTLSWKRKSSDKILLEVQDVNEMK